MNHQWHLAARMALAVALTFAGSSAMAEEKADSEKNNPTAEFEQRTFKLEREGKPAVEFKYRLLKPAKIEAGKKYPVVFFMHGAGERGSDNEVQLKYLPASMATAERREKYPCFVVAPQCRTDARWVEVDWSDKQGTPMTKVPGEQMQMAIGILKEVLSDEATDHDRVYLTGLSMGGYGSWYLAARHPELFAAVAPICGGGDEAKADALADLPLWAFHGDADQAVPVERSRRMIKAIEAAGGKPKYTEYPDFGHHSWVPAYADDSGLLDWLFRQRREK